MKALCKDRNMQVMPCTFWNHDSKTCANPMHFRCPEYIKERGMGEDPLSHSSMENYVACRRRFYYSFFLGLQNAQKKAPLYVGSACHEVLELVHASTVYPDVREMFIQRYMPDDPYADYDMSNSVIAASALMQVYVESELNRPKGETEVQWVLDDPPMIGYVDMVEGKAGFEWKIASKPDYYTKYTMEEQLCTYFLGIPELEKMHTRILIKPKLRRGKNESTEEYEERCKDDIRRRPSHYLHEDTYYRHEFDIPECLRKVKYVHAEIMRLLNSDDTIMESFYQNKNVCLSPFACDYLSICQAHGIISDELYVCRDKTKENQEKVDKEEKKDEQG